MVKHPINVLHISHLYPRPYRPRLGAAIHHLVRHVSEDAVNSVVVSPIPYSSFPLTILQNKWKNYAQVPDQDMIDDIKVYYPRFLDFPRAWFRYTVGYRMYSGIKKTITEISEDFPLDLIHAHTGLADGHVGMLLAKYYNIPLITTIRSMDIYHEMNRNKISYNILKNILQYSAQVITLSPASKQKLIAEFNQPSLIIPNGIYTEQSLDIVNIPSTIHDQYRNKRILVSVSDLIERKRIDLNIHAVAKLRQNYPDILYLIIGEGEHRITLEKLVEELECTKHVRFLGEVPHSQVFKYMKAANIFTLPSYDETFGLVYLEAMLCGTPVIGTKNEGIDGVIHHKQTGMLVESGNIVELEEAIQYLIDNPEKADRMGEAGRLLVVNNYSWSQIADRLRQVYFNTKKLLGD